MYPFLWLVLSSMLVVGCAAVQQGPPIELVDIATPTVVDEAQRPPAVPVSLRQELSLPPQSRSGFRVWIPRTVTANGDVYEGHYIEVSDKPPQKELVKPDYEIPKAPKQISRPAPRPASPPGAPPASGTSPRPSPLPSPSLPPQGGAMPGYPLPQEGGYEPVQP